MRVLLLALLLLTSCATTTTSTVSETTAVTKTLLVSQTFGRFQDAVAISTDQFGNTYVVDRGGPAVIKYNERGDSLGVISGFGREQYQFDMPSDIDARLTNSILIADHNNHRIERYTRDFAYSATIERRQGDLEQLRFGYPTQVAADDAGNFYLLDGENKRVLRVNSNMRLERIIGAYTSGSSPTGTLINPTKLAVDGSENLIVYDESSRALIVYDNLGNVLKRRDQISPLTSPNAVRALATISDTLFVLQSVNDQHRIRLFHTGSLTSLGIWELLIEGKPTLRDFDVRNGVTLLASDRVLRANLSMQVKE
jgi:hypothetical protein